MHRPRRLLCSLLPVALAACTGDPADTGETRPTASTLPDRYDFQDRFGDGSSVSYSGQTFRHLLVHDLGSYLDGLTGRIDAGFYPEPGDIRAELTFYLAFDSSTSAGIAHAYASDPAPLQATYGEVATDKDLLGKLAGNDPEGQSVDWNTGFVGWSEPGVTSPESLVWRWVDEIDAAGVAWANGDRARDPSGAVVPAVFVSADGRNRQELLAKFLTGAVAYSQAADDYLDDDRPDAGLNSPHGANEADAPYSSLEHAWDEAFGYFGAARDLGLRPLDAVADPGYADTLPADGAIDLTAEVNWSPATYAAKRDLGGPVPTDYARTAFSAFVAGRALLAATPEPLDADQQAALAAHRDAALGAWETAMAATLVHYLNETLVETLRADTPEYDFATHAEAWSEAKGIALSLQFNPRCPLTDAERAALNDQLGLAPVLGTASPDARAAAADALRAAKATLATAYALPAENLGGDDGLGGW